MSDVKYEINKITHLKIRTRNQKIENRNPIHKSAQILTNLFVQICDDLWTNLAPLISVDSVYSVVKII